MSELARYNQPALATTTDDLLDSFAAFLRLDVAQGDASPATVRTYLGAGAAIPRPGAPLGTFARPRPPRRT